MKVRELIALLQRKDPEASVLVMTDGDPLYAELAPELMDLPLDGSVVICPET